MNEKAHPPDDEDDEEGSNDDDDPEPGPDYDGEEDEDDPFAGFRGGGPQQGLSHTLRALSGMMSGVSSRLREILANLKAKDDPSIQLIALQELSEILLVSTEDNLAGHFSPDAFVKELVILMQPSDWGEENPEMMLLACRCLANLMEALPASTANVVYGGAVPILCQKLLEIHFIDLAEQALSTLEKISVEYPASIVREGGLTACLTYLDFFATSTQRSAVTTAANCCRNIPEDSFPVIKDVMPILLNVLGSNDQKVVEQGSLCVSRVVESFKYHPNKLEELVSPDLLRAVLRLLLPGTTNLISSNIHTQFLRVLAFTAKASPILSAELFKMNVVETLYQILTGVSPPVGTEDVASKLDSVVIMQALIHRPREQIIETLNVVCELLPGLPKDNDAFGESSGTPAPMSASRSSSGSRRKSPNEKRIELLEGCRDEVKRFAIILFPTLTDAFSSTVNLSVRQKVLTAHQKMLSNLETDILTEALKSVPYASFLAAILSQQDHPSLVYSALQAAELLIKRLDDIYRYQFYREGVIAEISKLAVTVEKPEKDEKVTETIPTPAATASAVVESAKSEIKPNNAEEPDNEDDKDSDADTDPDEDNENEHDVEGDDPHDDEDSDNESSRDSVASLDAAHQALGLAVTSMQQLICLRAKSFIEEHETEKSSKAMKKKATKILAGLQSLAHEIENCYIKQKGSGNGIALFEQLASHFEGDVLESVTSAELLHSEVVRVLLEVFSNADEHLANSAREAFLEVFMGRIVSKKPKTVAADSPATPFSVLIHKLQDLLSRSEHFEVITVHQNAFDGNRSSAASMLAKQIRLKLVADEDSGIPKPYRNIMVSIHAIATFKALDDYLRPRISLSDRSRGVRREGGLSGALAALAAAGMPNPYSSSGAAARLEARQFALAMAGRDQPPPPPPPAAAPAGSRNLKKLRSQSTPVDTPTTAESSTPKEKPRRSSRRQAAQTEPTIPPPPPQEPDDLQSALECADERVLSEDEDMDDPSALDTIVGDLEEEMEDAPSPPEPGAVNLEVAAGGKITARKDDGTRIATPVGAASSSRSSSLHQTPASQAAATPTPTLASGPMSYAAAIQAVPQDWHLEFSLDDAPLSTETTIYRAVHGNTPHADEHTSRSVWSAVHPIRFKRVSGPPPLEPSSLSKAVDVVDDASTGIPASLDKHPATSSILRLLNILHALNANLDDVVAENKDTLKLNTEPLSQFVNTKLTAKLNRQLEEPLIVASNCLPTWSEDLARLYPFLFPFETRHLFLQSTSFGYARSMTRWQNAQSADESRRDRHRDERPFLGRLQRQKVRIARLKILESALKVMDLYGSSQSILEVEYFEEVGTGLGPTLEFYSTVSKEFSKKKLKLWRENDSTEDEYAFGKSGLFPAPMSEEQALNENGDRILKLFKCLGKFVARSMIDSRIIDVSFNPTFFRVGDGSKTVSPSLGAVKTVDSQLAASLKMIKKFVIAKKAVEENPKLSAAQKVEDAEAIEVDGAHIDDLGLDFTYPGYDIELLPNGSQIAVNIDNVELYLDKVIDMTLGSGVQRQVDAFRAGFTQVFPYSALSAFTPDELVMLFGRTDEDWSLESEFSIRS